MSANYSSSQYTNGLGGHKGNSSASVMEFEVLRLATLCFLAIVLPQHYDKPRYFFMILTFQLMNWMMHRHRFHDKYKSCPCNNIYVDQMRQLIPDGCRKRQTE